MTKEEKCRKIAEWLEPEPAWVFHGKPFRWESLCWFADGNTEACDLSLTVLWQPRDFFTDEAANALVLEKMPRPHLEKLSSGEWYCRAFANDPPSVREPDRKTCIAEACLKLIDTPHDSRQTR